MRSEKVYGIIVIYHETYNNNWLLPIECDKSAVISYSDTLILAFERKGSVSHC